LNPFSSRSTRNDLPFESVNVTSVSSSGTTSRRQYHSPCIARRRLSTSISADD
jgi:hypothetical protein